MMFTMNFLKLVLKSPKELPEATNRKSKIIPNKKELYGGDISKLYLYRKKQQQQQNQKKRPI